MKEQENEKKPVKKKKGKLAPVLFGLLFLIGFGILAYPTISNQWNTYRQSQLISSYNNKVEEMTPEDFSEEWQKAEEFNATITHNNLYGDVFGEDDGDLKNTDYWKVLNVADDGVMGYLSIPKINIKLAIYHGTADDVLQTGVGHLNGTKLPIGGESTHSILAAHRGLPSAKLFTDIDQLEAGDKFYIHVLDEVLAYQVDQILPMVDKDDHETLQKALQIEEGKDQVTLFTCTPYGVNSHRLLVRGTRVPYNGEEDASAQTVTDTMLHTIQNYYMLYLILGIAITILIIVMNLGSLPGVFARIFEEAFGFRQAAAGGFGAVLMNGIKRGLFSNEAGSGSAPCAAAAAECDQPVKAGLVQALGVFVDTIVICSCTAFIMLLAPEEKVTGLSGMDLLQTAMEHHLGRFGVIFIAATLFLFSFSTFLGILFYARCNVAYLFGDNWASQTAYKVLALVMLFIGGLAAYTFVWDLGDVGIGLMTIFNIIILYPQGEKALKELKEYEKEKRK